MADLHPIALRRMLALRQFPILCDAELGELALFAENVTEVTLPSGTMVATAGARVAGLHLILRGEIATTGPQVRTWGAQQVFGALEVLADRNAYETVMTTTETTTLQLLAPDVSDILEDSIGVMLSTLRILAAQARLRPRRARTAEPVVHSLGLVERLIVLRQQLGFASAPLEPLVAIAHASEEVALPRGTLVTRAGAPGTSSHVIVEGMSRATDASGMTRALGPGEAIGHLELLGNLPHDETVEVVTPVRALRISASALLDVIEDHTDLGRAILAVLAGDLLDASPLTN